VVLPAEPAQEWSGLLRRVVRLADGVATDLAKMGIRVVPLEEYEWHKGSFETTWVDEQGVRHASSGIRRAGKAAWLVVRWRRPLLLEGGFQGRDRVGAVGVQQPYRPIWVAPA
jgi:hypothetical protein